MAHHVLKVQVTLEIDESVLQRLQEEAERRKTTMSDLADAMLRLGLAMPEPAGSDPQPLRPLPSWRSGGFRAISPTARHATKCLTKRECWSSTPTCLPMPSHCASKCRIYRP